VTLRAKAQQTVPPKNLRSLYGRITTERFGVLGAAKRLGRVLLGRRV